MATKRVETLLELRLAAASTPARVEAAAHLFREALDAAVDGSTADAVTMVVENFSMKIGLRAWKPRGRTAISRLTKVMRNPLRELQRRPAALKIAQCLARDSADFVKEGAEIFVPKEKEPVAVIDETFVKTFEGMIKQSLPEADAVRGGDEIHSYVLRVGRADESKHLSARIRMDGQVREVGVADLPEAKVRALFDAARDERLVRLQIEGVWLRDEGGEWALDPSRVQITGISTVDPISGADFLAEATAAIGEATPEEFKSLLEDLD